MGTINILKKLLYKNVKLMSTIGMSFKLELRLTPTLLTFSGVSLILFLYDFI